MVASLSPSRETVRPTLLTAERQRAILRLIAENGRITVEEIARGFGVSAATARRDAMHLAVTGQAFRTYGGLLPARFAATELHFRARAERQSTSKVRLAHRAVEFLPHEGAVFVDAGTTCLEIGRVLLGRRGLKIYTHSIPLLALAADAQATVIGLGGEARRASLALIGALALSWLAQLRFDVAVIGATGLNLDDGAGTTEVQEAAIKAEALRRSKLRILVADAEKWDRPATVRFAPWTAFDAFVTTAALPEHARRHLAAAGVRLCGS